MGSLYLTVTSISVFSRQALAINNIPFIYFILFYFLVTHKTLYNVNKSC